MKRTADIIGTDKIDEREKMHMNLNRIKRVTGALFVTISKGAFKAKQ